MPEFIPKDAAAAIIRKLTGYYSKEYKQIPNIPAADVEKVIHGHWIPTHDEDKKRCSVCDTIFMIFSYPYRPANRCPYCEAKMDLKEEV